MKYKIYLLIPEVGLKDESEGHECVLIVKIINLACSKITLYNISSA